MIFEFRVWFRYRDSKDFDYVKVEANSLEEGKIKAKATKRFAFCVEEV